MKRTDSGFHESIFSNVSQNESAPIHRSNTAPTRRRKPITTSSVSISSSRPMMTECQRPGSEHPSRPFNQRSGASSSRNSTDQSRGRNPSSSKACSRGTSRTGVDPSRPSRHYRIQSSHTAPVITSRDIDDPVALHFRSCSLFQNPSYHAHSALPSPTLSHQSQMGRPSIASRFTDDIDVVEEYAMPKQSEEAFLAAEKLNTTMHWTSPDTRQQEYKRIDKSNSGLRGLMKKVMPRCVSGPQERFYESNRSHAGSVRRYRLDNDDEKSGAERETSSAGKTSAAAMRNQKKKNWGCF